MEIQIHTSLKSCIKLTKHHYNMSIVKTTTNNLLLIIIKVSYLMNCVRCEKT